MLTVVDLVRRKLCKCSSNQIEPEAQGNTGQPNDIENPAADANVI